MSTSAAGNRPAEITGWPGSGESIQRILRTWPYRPYLACPDTSSEGRVEYLFASLVSAQERGATTRVAQADGEVQALAQWELLPWDTQMLGFPVARISALYRFPSEVAFGFQKELLHDLVEEVRAAAVQYLMVRVPAGDIPAIGQLESLGFRMVDGILSFGRSLQDLPPQSGPDIVRTAGSQHISALREIAGASFSIDRFHSDPAIGPAKADEVQRAWIENSCTGLADCVLVVEVDGELAGFTTLKLDRLAENKLGIRMGVIELVAVLPRFRRRGLAHALSLASLHWFHRAGCQWAEVGTQVANIHAARVYQSAGFLLTASSLTLRKLL